MDNVHLMEKLGSLKDELEELFKQTNEMMPEDIKELFYKQMKAYAESDIVDAALREGDFAPDFCLPDSNGNLISSVDLRAQGPLVVIFFRGKWCAFCDATLRMLRKYAPHFIARGANVVAISPQTLDASAETTKIAGLDIHVLSDTNSEYAQSCQIAYVLDDLLKPLHEHYDIPSHNGEDSFILPIPATYVIGTNGKVIYSHIDSDFTKRAEPLHILNALPPLSKQTRNSLAHKIDMELATIRDKHLEFEMRSMFDEIERLKSSGDIESSALQVGQTAPDFKLTSSRGHVIDSKKLRKNGVLIVTFHHGHNSPICMLALNDLEKHSKKFEAKGACIVAISRNSTREMHKTKALSGATFPLLSDQQNQVANNFGIACEYQDNLFERGTLPVTATYIIDRKGKIVSSFVDCDFTKRPEASSILKAVPVQEQPRQSLKFGPFSLFAGRRLAPRTGPVNFLRASI